MKEKMILYVQTSDAPERQYSPLVLAQAARAMDIKPIIFYLGTSLKVLQPQTADSIQLGSFPSIGDMLQQTLQQGIEILVCEATKQVLGWDRVELVPGVKIVGAATLNDLALDADATMWF